MIPHNMNLLLEQLVDIPLQLVQTKIHFQPLDHNLIAILLPSFLDPFELFRIVHKLIDLLLVLLFVERFLL